jgi:hypothetical protein
MSGVMAFGLGKLADPLHEGERFPEIVESKCALDAAGFIAQVPIRSLALEAQGFITPKRRNAAATWRACSASHLAAASWRMWRRSALTVVIVR